MVNAEDANSINYDKLGAFKAPQQPQPPKTSYLLNASLYGMPTENKAQNEYDQEPPPERPGVVTLVAVINYVAAALLAIVAIIALPQDSGRSSSGGVFFLSAFAAVFSLAIGVGLWRLKVWAYWLAIIGYGLSLLTTLIGVLNKPLTGSVLLQLVIPAVLLYFLARSDTRASFAM